MSVCPFLVGSAFFLIVVFLFLSLVLSFFIQIHTEHHNIYKGYFPLYFMVNVIRMRQQEREAKIIKIEGSIKKALAEGQNISLEKTVFAAAANLMISKRTALEYVDIALFRLGMKRADLDAALFSPGENNPPVDDNVKKGVEKIGN